MKRREFLTGLLALGALSALPAGARQVQRTRRLVAIHLFGGNDGLNTVVPASDPHYRRLRPTLALTPSELLPLRSGLGLHPALQPLFPLWERGHLAVIQGVGYPNPNRSHFLSSDIWHGAGRSRPDGWLGRLAAQQRWEVLQVDQQALSRALWTPPGSPTLPLAVQPGQNLDSPLPPRLQATLDRLYRQSCLAGTYRQWSEVQRRLPTCPGERWQGAELRQSLGVMLELWPMARLFHTSIGGWDTHGDQRPRQAQSLSELASALADFYAELQARGWDQDTTIFVYSEFGRRAEENASAGTDHGGAGPVLLIGGGVKGGLYGEHPSLSDLAEGGDLKHGTDFREVYASLVEGWLEADSRSVLGGSFGTVACWA